MHKQTLKNLFEYHRDTTFEQFCREIFSDFDPVESCGYLHEKFELFQNRFMLFLSELDDVHFENVALAVTRRYGHFDPKFDAVVVEAKQIQWDSADSERKALDLIRVEICPMMLITSGRSNNCGKFFRAS